MDMPEGADQHPLVLVSNRGPVEYSRDGGERTSKPGKGGLVTALAGLSSHFEDVVWICAALSEEDAAVAREHNGAAFDLDRGGPGMRLRMVELDPEMQHRFYAVISNPLLWFV
ncbi:MAG: trehalose-6-phosphate synthase, partial [Actinomycetota bacterium]|nr:trehalose-6-phosphate synthase [Actinomycetota bacterium]